MDTATPSFRVFPEQRHQTVRYFGASACWWASGVGTSPKMDSFLKLLFTDEGLGLTNIRINIGGSVLSDRSDSENSMSTWRGVLSPLKENGTYDITRCPGTWNILQKANAMEQIEDITLFMNSPPSTMTKNGKTSSDKTGQKDVFISNLRPECYEAYAKYVVDVTQLYVHAGIRVRYVSPINEPQWAWDGGQEGCHYEPEELIAMMRLLVRELEARKKEDPLLEPVLFSLPETAQWYQVPYVHDIYALMSHDPEFAPYVDHFCAHSYGTTREQKMAFAEFARQQGRKLSLHQTEWGPMHDIYDPTMDTALELATVLHDDLTILHTDIWSWWLGLGSFTYTDGLICVTPDLQRIEFPKRYYVMKQHSRYIKDHICVTVEKQGLLEEVLGSAYLSPDGNRMVWELVNPLDTDISLHLKGMAPGCCGYVMETSQQHSCEETGVICADDPLTLPKRSVITVVFPNISGGNL